MIEYNWEPGMLAHILPERTRLVKVLVVAGKELAVTSTSAGGEVWWYYETELEPVQ